MMEMEKQLWPSLRLAFTYQGELDEPEFEERLRVGNLTLENRREKGDLEVLECESRDPGFVSSVTLTRSRELADMGCAYFSGPDRIDVAMSLVTVLQFIPAGLLHLGARAGPDRQVRVNSLQVLSQLYLAEEGGACRDSHVEHTTRLVRGDADRELRWRALFIELVGKLPGARRHIRELLEAETEARERQVLEDFLARAERQEGTSEAVEPAEAAPEPELRLALPFMQRSPPLDALLEHLESVCERVQEIREGDTRWVELRARELDGRMTFLSPEGSDVGCLYFSGADAAEMAIGTGSMLAYLPPELARLALRSSRFDEYRVQALHALALSASTRILPGGGVDAELRALLQAAMVDPVPEVKGAAMNMSFFLREELSRAG
ncbi:MAG TPA: hypothetical protein VFZ09_03545 [Archangium sp.]|uniref:hypothetical protein n=1 Tax=Archangium sp. TaxID=1872627 RepID=UPI002E2F5652|nr:hypothetical protein [Archangium sp.]HEX5745291.1 hypothetical protein [Archangium sp.]